MFQDRQGDQDGIPRRVRLLVKLIKARRSDKGKTFSTPATREATLDFKYLVWTMGAMKAMTYYAMLVSHIDPLSITIHVVKLGSWWRFKGHVGSSEVLTVHVD